MAESTLLGKKFNRMDVFNVPVPAATETWQPIPHHYLINELESWVKGAGFEIRKETHALAHEGARYFGVFDLVNGHNQPDYGLSVGVRNSHDMRFPAGLCVGSRVFVCDNLAFSGEITLARKHTRWILRDLTRLCATAFGKVGELRQLQGKRIETYKGFALDDRDAHDLLIKAVDCRVIPNADVPHVLAEYRAPRHDEFKARNAWSLFNAFTEIAKEGNVMELSGRTQRLHGLLDNRVGLLIPANAGEVVEVN